MKEYFKRFWPWYAIVGVLIAVYVVLSMKAGTGTEYQRTNTECLTEERVFDEADKLSEKEETKLRALIAEREKQTGLDIVLITLNEPGLDSDAKMREYAQTFCREYKFGYNEPVGDAVIYVDNWYNGYVWMTTSGKAHARMTDAMIDNVIDRACAVVNSNPYKGYERYVNQVHAQMTSKLGLGNLITPMAIFLTALIVTVIYLIVNLSGRKGKKTTNAETYIARDAQPMLHNTQDVFVTKHTTRRRIESSSGGGGGGGTRSFSSGGHSFGGGGGRH